MKYLLTLLALLPLLGSCQSVPGQPSPVSVVADFNGDGWIYADLDTQVFVGQGAAYLRIKAYGMQLQPQFPVDWDDDAVWIRSEEHGEFFIGLSDAWPLWMEPKLSPQDLSDLSEHFGLSVTFE